jgi:hypothetical protein
MGRRIRHAPSAARGTEAAALAREGDDTVEPALVAVYAHEAVGEDSAAQEGSKLALDEARRWALTGTGADQEGLQLVLDDAVEHALLGAAAHVAGVAAARAVTGRR